MSKEQLRGHSDEIHQVSRRRQKASQSAATLTSLQLELSLSLDNRSHTEQPDRGDTHAPLNVHIEAPTISRVTGLADPSREKHQNAIVASRDELIGELSAYLRTDLKSLDDPALRDFTPDEAARFSEWVEGLSDEQLGEEIELRGEMLTERIKKLATQRRR